MLKGIDHIVIVAPELDSAIASYRQLGFTVVPGGRHPTGSHNALIAFDDGSYIELIAFFDRGNAHPWNAALGRGGGLADFCMQTDDIARDIETFRRAGVAMSDPAPLNRVRPDGYRLAWVLSLPPPPFSGVAPFLIRDQTPRAERVPRMQGHRNNVTGIDALSVAVREVASIARIFEAASGTTGAEVNREDLGARGVRFAIGPHRVEFLQPTENTDPLADWLRARGPSPYAVTLAAPKGEHRPLDIGLAQNARLLIA